MGRAPARPKDRGDLAVAFDSHIYRHLGPGGRLQFWPRNLFLKTPAPSIRTDSTNRSTPNPSKVQSLHRIFVWVPQRQWLGITGARCLES